MSVAPLISIGSGRLTWGIKSLYIPACKCFLFSPLLFFLLCSTQDLRWWVKIVKSSTILVGRGPDFQWVGSQWHNSGVGAWFALNTASAGTAKQLFAYSTSVNPHPSVCSWTMASRHFPPEKSLPSNMCEPQCQIPWQVPMTFTKALRILISWVSVAHSIHHFLCFSKLLSRNMVLQQNPTATSPLATSPRIKHPSGKKLRTTILLLCCFTNPIL